MKYELAKKLKDAWFRQDCERSYYLNAGENTGRLVDTSFYEDAGGEFIANKLVACPTLTELIEACGERFIGLNNKKQDNPPSEGWVAIGNPMPQEIEKWVEKGHGETPEEAVANLWIALQTKEIKE